MLIRG
ncbi:hypothetical protein D039_1253A, partial [Vibrio parahaemolyticus EKP-028]